MQNKQLTMEPDRARVYALNLVRHRRKFALEVDPTLPGMKDVVCIAIDGEFQKDDKHDYVDMHARSVDEACQFAYNCCNSEVSFAVNPMTYPDGRAEWMFTAVRRKR